MVLMVVCLYADSCTWYAHTCVGMQIGVYGMRHMHACGSQRSTQPLPQPFPTVFTEARPLTEMQCSQSGRQTVQSSGGQLSSTSQALGTGCPPSVHMDLRIWIQVLDPHVYTANILPNKISTHPHPKLHCASVIQGRVTESGVKEKAQEEVKLNEILIC